MPIFLASQADVAGFVPSVACSVEHHAVADEVVGSHKLVVDAPRYRVALLRMPIKPRPAAVAGARDKIFDQGLADAVASRFDVDEEVLQVADRRERPGARMKHADGEAGHGSLPFGEASEHVGSRRQQSLPGC